MDFEEKKGACIAASAGFALRGDLSDKTFCSFVEGR